MVYSPAPLARQRTKPTPWNAQAGLVAPEWQGAWRGLRNAYALWGGSGRPYNLVTQTQLDPGGVSAPTWVPTSDGVAPEFYDGSTDRGWDFPFDDLSWLSATAEYSMAMVLDTDHRTGLWWAFRLINGAGTQQFQLFADPSNGRVRHRADTSGSGTNIVDDNYSPYQNSRVAVVLRYNGSEITFWRDGVERASTGASGTLGIDNGNTSRSFGYNGGGDDRAWAGRIPVFYAWDRALSYREIELLTEDPYGLLRPNWDYLTAAGQNVDVGQATEVESSQPITPLIDREVAVGQATEAETANPITARISREVVIGQAIERELARTITPDIEGPILVDVGQATERELANPIVPFIQGLVIGEIECTVLAPSASCAVLSPTVTCEVI